jgi:aminopeptidase YwaD
MKRLDFNALTKECLEKTADITRRFPSRLAGSEMCRKAAHALYKDMRAFCDSSRLHSFHIHSTSYGYTKLLPLIYVIGIVTFFIGSIWTLVPLIGLPLGICMIFIQFGLGGTFLDGFYKKKPAVNVIGSLEPAGTVRQQIIISGHHDSAPVTRLYHPKIQKLLVFTMFTPYLFYFYQIFLSSYVLLSGIKTPAPGYLVVLTAGIPFVALYFFAVDTKHGTPGAGDNMIASVIALCVGKRLAQIKKTNHMCLAHTRIILLSFDAEELVFKGASAYFKDYKSDLTSVPTYHLNLESLYKLKDLQVLTSDANGFQKLSKDMAERIVRIGSRHGITVKPFHMVFGGGSTDAGASARSGISSSTIFGLPTALFRSGLVYHTAKDTVDHIEPEIVTACLRLIWEYIVEMENRAAGSS